MKLFSNYYRLHKQIKQGSGSPLVFLHGLGSSGRYWRPVVRELTAGKVISYDLLGFGQSPKPEPFAYSLTDQVKALRRSLRRDAPFQKVTLVGHSMGGLVALEFARRYPKKVKTLVLTNVPVLLSRHDFAVVKKRYDQLPDRVRNSIHSRVVQALHGSKLVKSHVLPRYAHYKLRQPEFNKYDMEHLSPYAYAQSLKHLMQVPLVLRDLSKIKAPVYVVQADKDRAVIVGNTKKLVRALPNAEIIFAKGTHQFPRLEPVQFAQILQKILT